MVIFSITFPPLTATSKVVIVSFKSSKSPSPFQSIQTPPAPLYCVPLLQSPNSTITVYDPPTFKSALIAV